MSKTKQQITRLQKARAPSAQRQPEVPDAQDGPETTSTVRKPSMMPAMAESGSASRARAMTHVQRTVGNTRANRTLNRTVAPSVQTKLTVGAPDDLYEQEADRVANEVMSSPQDASAANSAPGQQTDTALQRQIKAMGDEPDAERTGSPIMAEGKEPVPEPGEDTAEQGAMRIQRRPLQAVPRGAMVQRQPAPAPAAGAAAPAAAPALTLSPADQRMSASLLNTLDEFQNIPIDVPGVQTLPPDTVGPPAPITVRVHVHAQYFINTETARAHYQAERRTERFGSIIRALARRGEMSVLEGGRGPRGAGRAVEYGKASPADIKNFVEEAISQGIIQQYAVRRRAITASQQLTDLAPADLQDLIQGWMRHTGVGVDCSGFVQQAAIRAREEERARISALNAFTGLFGLPPMALPPAIDPQERSARSFRRGAQRRRPTDLRPGDAWVVTGGGHVRIVTDVREATLPSGSTTVEFDTAESSGGSTSPDPGPVARTWRTRSLATFHPITAVGHTARARGGTFHSIP